MSELRIRVSLHQILVDEIQEEIGHKAQFAQLFIPHQPQKKSVLVDLRAALSDSTQEWAFVPFDPQTCLKPATLGVWWWADDDGQGLSLQGTAYVFLHDLFEAPHEIKAFNTLGHEVAAFQVSLSSTTLAALPKAQLFELTSPLKRVEAYNKRVSAFLEAHASACTIQHKYAGLLHDRWRCSSVVVPHPLPCTRVPMWSFPWRTLLALNSSSASPETEDTKRNLLVDHLLELGLHRTGLVHYEPEDFKGDDLIHIFTEMAVATALAIPYRPDHSGNEALDQWLCLRQHPLPNRACLDCEDLAEHILYVIECIRHYAGARPPLVKRIQKEVLAVYEFFMCIGVLETASGDPDDDAKDPTAVWHCYVMGLDKAWMNQRLQTAWDDPCSANASHTNISVPARPALVLEGTNYIESNLVQPLEAPDFSQRPYTQEDAMYRVPAPEQLALPQYHEGVLLLTPQYLDQHGIGELYLFQKGRLGVDVSFLRTAYQDNVLTQEGLRGLAFHCPVRVSVTTLKAVLHATSFQPHAEDVDLIRDWEQPTSSNLSELADPDQHTIYNYYVHGNESAPIIEKITAAASVGAKYSVKTHQQTVPGGIHTAHVQVYRPRPIVA